LFSGRISGKEHENGIVKPVKSSMTHSVFIKLAGIGDLLMLTPAIRAYMTAFPEEEIFFVTGESNKGILKNNPYIDRLIPLDDFVFFPAVFQKSLERLRN
jgi:hypothetical protein